ncbi:MAG: S8 family serine peptidase [Melioribacteraceae bacterium]|nr:S8 family serine peptidase [Melioribacteraceae bacterium]
MKKLFLFGCLFFASIIFAQEFDQSFIALKSTGVKEFLQKFPEYDGRGTLILVMDSGVDFGIDGLTTTTTGEKKVLDVQDFSGEGDFYYLEAEIDEERDTLFIYNEKEKLKVKVHQNNLLSNNEEFFIGAIDEQHWKNSSSGTTDLDNNGKSDDKFVFIVFKPTDSENWVVYLDSNNDGMLDDEKPIMNYKINQDDFIIKTVVDEPQYTMGLNIFPGDKKVVFHYDGVSHGTHCAGIALGNKIGNDEFYGVAPGAYLGSLKIGSSIYSGGATTAGSMKDAYDYADKLSRELDMPIIINMSYGIGSEIHGLAEMEKYLDKLVSANPNLYISVSAGNEGPGISTVGLPSSSNSVFVSGAVLAKEVGHDLYSAPIDRDVILHFSSRGGEVNKPDLVSPGAATSTVPYWTRGDRFWGTSMAAPYTAGVMSLLLSAMKVEHPDIKVPSLVLYKAMRESAVPLQEYDPIDQGGGLINVMNAYELLKKYIKDGEINKFETYTISSDAPTTPSGKADQLYIRNGSYLTGVEKFTYSIARNNFNKTDKFFRSYNIKSEADWIITISNKTYIRNDQKAQVTVQFDKSKLNKPGLYSGKVVAYRSDNSKTPEFEMIATVVLPHKFTPENKYRLKTSGKLAPAEINRYFLEVPPAASSMKVTLSYDEGKYCNTWYSLHDPEGRGVGGIRALESEKGVNSSERFYYDLIPGVYELVVVGQFTAVDSVDYNLDVEFQSIQIVEGNKVEKLQSNVTVVNNYSDVLRYKLSGAITGYEKEYTVEFKDEEIVGHKFSFKEDEDEKIFELSVSPEHFNKVTDFAVVIYNNEGKIVSNTGFGYKDASISLSNSSKENTEYTLTFVPAFVDTVSELNVFVKEITNLKEEKSFKVTNKSSSNTVLYPSTPEQFILDIDFSESNFDENVSPIGKIKFENSNGKVEYELPIYINF